MSGIQIVSTAGQSGVCSVCLRPIRRGAQIVVVSNEWLHPECQR